jgi:type I restriction enzyme S subunit
MTWNELPFEELYTIPSRNGLSRPSKVRGTGYRMINMGELFGYDRISSVDMELVPMNGNELSNMLVKENDLLFARQSLVLAGAGKCSIIKDLKEPTTFESHIIRVRLDNKRANPIFYYYYFKSPACRIKSIVTQGVQAGIRGNDLKKLIVQCPPLATQNKIASILSAYDDLIENNNRRITLLEESARLLYREWFVKLKFPGYETTKITDGVPEGWERVATLDAMEVQSGGTPKTNIERYWNGDIPFYTPKDSVSNAFVANTEKTLTEEGLKKCNSKLYPEYTIFITARGTVGNLNIALTPMAMNQSCYALCGKDGVSQLFLYCAMKESIEHFKQHAIGAVFNAIVVKTFKMIPFLMPIQAVIQTFTDLITPSFKQLENLIRQNQKLKATRDLLLPKLMNGDIPV